MRFKVIFAVVALCFAFSAQARPPAKAVKNSAEHSYQVKKSASRSGAKQSQRQRTLNKLEQVSQRVMKSAKYAKRQLVLTRSREQLEEQHYNANVPRPVISTELAANF